MSQTQDPLESQVYDSQSDLAFLDFSASQTNTQNYVHSQIATSLNPTQETNTTDPISEIPESKSNDTNPINTDTNESLTNNNNNIMPILIPQSQPGAIPSISASTQRHIMDTQSQTQTQTQLPNIMDARGIGFDTQSQQP
eukprot:1004256_1